MQIISVANRPPCANQVFGLDLAGPHLAVLGALLDILHQFLLLVLQLHSFAVQLALCAVEGALVFAQTLRWRHAFAERPFNDLVGGAMIRGKKSSSQEYRNTHIHGDPERGRRRLDLCVVQRRAGSDINR